LNILFIFIENLIGVYDSICLNEKHILSLFHWFKSITSRHINNCFQRW